MSAIGHLYLFIYLALDYGHVFFIDIVFSFGYFSVLHNVLLNMPF
jgi:hypothetical protein